MPSAAPSVEKEKRSCRASTSTSAALRKGACSPPWPASRSAARSEPGATNDQQPATVSLTTDYLGPAKEGDWLESTTRVERVAERMAFADCSLRVDGREIVRARAVFAAVS